MQFKVHFDKVDTTEKPDEEETRKLTFTHNDGILAIRVTIAGKLSDITEVEQSLECRVGAVTTLEIGGAPPGQTQLPKGEE